MTTATPLRILCFGDSLTAGYSRFGMIMTPYSKTLKTELEIKFWAGEKRRKVDTTTNGLSGDLVTQGTFGKRMERSFSPQTLTPPPSPLYHYTIFLGGTNDLGWGKSPTEIWDAVKTITSIPLTHGSKVLLMTVPECQVKDKILDAKRDELNTSIKGDNRAGVYTFDLHAAIPYHSLSEGERDEIWDDGLHFTSKGYERLGELVAARLMEILESEEAVEEKEGE